MRSSQRFQQMKLQKSLKKAYEEEIEKFDNRGSSVPSKTKAIISDTPIN